MSAGIQRNDTQQYCTLDESASKSLPHTYVQFSPTSTSDWWAIKSEVDSPKETSGWSSDSDSSQQTIIYGSGNGSTGGDGSLEGMQSGDNSSIGLSSTTTDDLAGKKKKKSKEASGHGKPSQVVQRRNARERKRVEAVNNAFQNLRKVVPIEENKSKRMSKVKTLQLAIEYISKLEDLLKFTTQRTNDSDLLDFLSDYQTQPQLVKTEPDYHRIAYNLYDEEDLYK